MTSGRIDRMSEKDRTDNLENLEKLDIRVSMTCPS